MSSRFSIGLLGMACSLSVAENWLSIAIVQDNKITPRKIESLSFWSAVDYLQVTDDAV